MSTLLFSFIKEFQRPKSCSGKVWRIHIVDGTLCVNDSVKFTSVNILKYPKNELYDVNAIVKTIRTELDYDSETVKEVDYANKGSIVTVDLKSCYLNNKHINKGDIVVTKRSIGVYSNEKCEIYNTVYVRFDNPEEAFEIINIKQDILLLWFGKRITAKVVNIDDSIEGMFVNFSNYIEIPYCECLRSIVKRVIFAVEHKGQFHYISGVINC